MAANPSTLEKSKKDIESTNTTTSGSAGVASVTQASNVQPAILSATQASKEPELSNAWFVLKGNPEVFTKSNSLEEIVFEKKCLQEHSTTTTAAATAAATATATATAMNTSIVSTNESGTAAATPAAPVDANNTAVSSNISDQIKNNNDAKGSKESQAIITLSHIVISRKKTSLQTEACYSPLKFHMCFIAKSEADPAHLFRSLKTEMLSSIPGIHPFFLYNYNLVLQIDLKDKTTYNADEPFNFFTINLRVGEMNATVTDAFFEYLIKKGFLSKIDAFYFRNKFEPRFPTKEEGLRLQELIEKQHFDKAFKLASEIHKQGLDEMQYQNDLDLASAVYFYLGNQLEKVSPPLAIPVFESLATIKDSPFVVLAIEQIAKISFEINAKNTKEEMTLEQRKISEKSVINAYGTAFYPQTYKYNTFPLFIDALERLCGFNPSLKEKAKLFDTQKINSITDILIAMADKLFELNSPNKKNILLDKSNVKTKDEFDKTKTELEKIDHKIRVEPAATATAATATAATATAATATAATATAATATAATATAANIVTQESNNQTLNNKTENTNLAVPDGFEIIEGDLKIFIENKDKTDYDEVIVFQKKKSLETTSSPIKSGTHWKELSLALIVVSKQPLAKFENKKFVYTKSTTITLSLLLTRNTASPMQAKDVTERYAINLARVINEKLLNQNNFENTLHNTLFRYRTIAGRTEHTIALEFAIGNMKKHISDVFFQALIELDFCSQQAAGEFQNIFGYKLLTDDEVKFNEEVITLINKGDFQSYNKAVEISKLLGHLAMLQHMNGGFFPLPIDDSPTAFELGVQLKTISPKHALEAFDSIEDYSPFFKQACLEVADIAFDISNRTEEFSVNDCKAYREKAIIKLVLAGLEDDHPKFLLCKLLEKHAGYETWGSNNRIFDKLTFQNSWTFKLDLALLMAEQLWNFKQPKNPIISQSASKAVPSASSASAAIAYAFNSQSSAKSLEEDDLPLESNVTAGKKL